jgi:cytochrome P450 family 6
VAKDRYELSGMVIEKGVSVFVPVFAIHKDPKIYPNPDKFDPERFTVAETKKRHPYTFLPFGEGPRNCIGIRFGQLQTKFGLALLLSKYRFSVHEKTQTPLKFESSSMIMFAKGGIWLRVEKL